MELRDDRLILPKPSLLPDEPQRRALIVNIPQSDPALRSQCFGFMQEILKEKSSMLEDNETAFGMTPYYSY